MPGTNLRRCERVLFNRGRAVVDLVDVAALAIDCLEFRQQILVIRLLLDGVGGLFLIAARSVPAGTTVRTLAGIIARGGVLSLGSARIGR